MILLILGGTGIGIAAVVVIGYCLPIKHRAVREASLSATPLTVWQLISDFQSAPRWRSDVKSVEKVTSGGETLWQEADAHGGTIAYRTLDRVPPKRLVRQIASPGLPFGGRWTFEIESRDRGCHLRITEDGEVYNPFYRFVSRFILGHTATLDKYLKSLERELAEASTR